MILTLLFPVEHLSSLRIILIQLYQKYTLKEKEKEEESTKTICLYLYTWMIR